MTEILKGSKKYRANQEKIEKALAGKEIATVEEAVETLLSLDQPNFKNGASFELHFKLNINPTKSDQLIRTTMTLPNGNGKEVRIAAFVTPENEKVAKGAGATIVGGEELINEIKKTGKIEFDTAIAEPEMMKKLPAIARILGVAGVMPSPKNQTVGTNIEEMVKAIKAGKVDVKNDKSGNLHILCGRTTFTKEQLVENINYAIEAVEKTKPEVIKKKFVLSAHVTTTLSPSIRIK